MDSVLKTEHIYFSYQNHEILKDVSLCIRKGECLVLAGRSGAGKTTFLRVMAGLNKIDSGRIYYEGTDITNCHPSARRMAFIFQDGALFSHTKVKDNITYGLHKLGYGKDQIQKKLNDVTELLGISHLTERYPISLSGGEKQRVGIARALIRDPEILLLDEPFANLDPPLRRQLLDEVKQIQKTRNMTAVLVTHDRNEALRMADRIAVLDKGGIIEEGDVQTICLHPKNLFTASFFSQFNTLTASVKDKVICYGGVQRKTDLPDGVYTACIRPQDISTNGNVPAVVMSSVMATGGYETEVLFGKEKLCLITDRQYFSQEVIYPDLPENKILLFDKSGHLTGNKTQ